CAAKAAGASVVLLDREPALGGNLRFARANFTLPAELDPERANGGQLTICLETTAFGIYEGNLVAAVRENSLLKIRARRIVVCTGGRQQPILYHNNDLPGVILGDGVFRLAHLHGVRAGRRAVIVTNCDDGHALAQQLDAIGIEVACIV